MRKDKSRISINSKEDKGTTRGVIRETRDVKPAIS